MACCSPSTGSCARFAIALLMGLGTAGAALGAEDFTRDIGALDDPLLVSAAHHADNDVCPVLLAAKPQLTRAEKAALRRAWTIDERESMLPR